MTGRDDCASCAQTTLHELVVLEPQPGLLCWEWRCQQCGTPGPDVRERIELWLRLNGVTFTWKQP